MQSGGSMISGVMGQNRVDANTLGHMADLVGL